MRAAAALLASLVGLTAGAHSQVPTASSAQKPIPKPSAAATHPPASDLHAAIDNLGKFDDTTRTAAARAVRRAEPAQAVPMLLDAASNHADGYVRFKALVLVSGFNDPRARDVMAAALDEPNDRLRTVAYAYFEHNKERGMSARLLKKLETENGEFVRPALTRALAAYGDESAVQTALNALVLRGEDVYRSAVIEALGDYHAAYALTSIIQVSKQDGPLQEDAILAMGKIGDKRALETLQDLQKSAPRVRQPAVASAICLLGLNCDLHEKFVVDTMTFAGRQLGFQDLLRASSRALAALAGSGRSEAAAALLDAGIPARDPARSPIALAFGTVALRNTTLVLKLFASRRDVREGGLLLRDAFDMLEEDYEEERFFAAVRRAYWQAPEGSPDRKAADALIQVLEF
ncbi:MAG TPA: HEAT repeat domain-containing protein [Vicinamibacterales bacterium]